MAYPKQKRHQQQSEIVEFPPRFADENFTPRRWAELSEKLRSRTTADLVKRLARFKNKPVSSWTPDDWGLMDAINHLVALRAHPKGAPFPNDLPKNQDEEYWNRVDARWEFYYNADYPGPQMPK
jgi:hypothetical protein